MMTKPLKFDVNKGLYPFEHKFLELGNGINMHYVDEGTGENLLMLDAASHSALDERFGEPGGKALHSLPARTVGWN